MRQNLNFLVQVTWQRDFERVDIVAVLDLAKVKDNGNVFMGTLVLPAEVLDELGEGVVGIGMVTVDECVRNRERRLQGREGQSEFDHDRFSG